jgi:AGCS family alanine or glycine:cation symporter
VCYSFFGVAAAFGVGNATQINAVISSLNTLGIGGPKGNLMLGLLLAVLVGWMLWGGADGIGKIAGKLVPLAAGGYILLCLVILSIRFRYLSAAFSAILGGAFRPEAVTGGILGSFVGSLRVGCARGVFTNEAGMGTAAIAHGGAEVDHPARQGLMGIMEVFLDTMVICTLTALVILTSGVAIPYGHSAGSELTAAALAESFGPWVRAALSGCLVLFALATILGWSFYAGRCAEFLFGHINWKWFGLCQGAAVFGGLFLGTGTVWTLAEIFNGLMAIPNLMAVLMLTGEVRQLTGRLEM